MTPDHLWFLNGSDSTAAEEFITFTHVYQAVKILSTYLQSGTNRNDLSFSTAT